MHFYFDLTDGTTILSDEAGTQADDLAQAVAQAQAVVAEMAAAGELDDLPGRWALSIRGEADHALTIIPIA